MLLIYLPAVSSRIEYIFEKIFTQEYGIAYDITSDINSFTDYKEEKINYSAKRLHDEFYIKAHHLLFENFIEKRDVPTDEKNQTVALFPNDSSCDVGFDVFAATFYMISRYEEYLSFTPDKYGRYRAKDGLAYKKNFIEIPVVDRWLIIFKKILQKRFPSLEFKKSEFKAILTYDVDVAYKFRGRRLTRNTGATVKDLLRFDFKNIKVRIQTLTGKYKDPWDTYDYLKQIIAFHNLPSVFFFLMGDSSQHDRNLSYKNNVMSGLINKIKLFSEIGIHPSFKSSISTEKIFIEKERLEKIANKTIIKSRQHFLRFTLPGTYNALIEAGIAEDYSMGFPDKPGFRAGTSKPFYFYDLENEKSTELKIFPVSLMDATFLYYLKLSPGEAVEIITKIIAQIKRVEGMFISIWHNNILSEDVIFRKWKWVHDEMITKLSQVT